MNPNFGSNQGQVPPESLDQVARLSLKQRLRLEMEASGLPHKALAIDAHMDEGRLSRVLSDDHKDALHAHSLPAVTRALGPGLMQWLAVRCGGTYVHGAKAAQDIQAPTALIALLAHHSGDTLQQLIQDLADNHWSPEERQSRLPGLRRLHLVVADLLHHAEGGEA